MFSITSVAVARVSLLVALVGILIGCEKADRYNLEKDEQGRTIRIDQQTGEIAVVEGNTIRLLQSEEDVKYEKLLEEDELATPSHFVETGVPFFGEDVKANVSTIWRNGSLHYKFFISPAPKKLLKARDEGFSRSGLTLMFFDSNDFEVTHIQISTEQLVGRRGDDNKLEGFERNGSLELGKSEYRSIASWNIGWYGFQ